MNNTTSITVERLKLDHFRAYLTTDKKISGTGKSIDEAIGNLVRTHFIGFSKLILTDSVVYGEK